jgi:nicotinamidase-related amidase
MTGVRHVALSRPRTAPVIPARTGFLIIDAQNGICARKANVEPHFYDAMHRTVIPNLVRLRMAARRAGVEVLYAVIESLTADGRDRCLDYKLTGFHFPRGSNGARMVPELTPAADEIVLPKTSSSPFNSTTLDYVLRNIGIEAVIVGGFQTDQCIDHTLRDGADRGYEMICVTDGCTAKTAMRHAAALDAVKGYCRQVTTLDLISELEGGNSGLMSSAV